MEKDTWKSAETHSFLEHFHTKNSFTPNANQDWPKDVISMFLTDDAHVAMFYNVSRCLVTYRLMVSSICLSSPVRSLPGERSCN